MTSNENKQPSPMDPVALKHKELGNQAYKEKKFDLALEEYDKAIAVDAANTTLYSNKAAVYFEQGEYDKCIEHCLQAVDVGRENRADFKLMGKALARAGAAAVKKNDLASAKLYYSKSLAEFRDLEVRAKLQQVSKDLKEQEQKAYVNPEMAEEEKTKGNQCFKDGKYPDAVKHYSEAIQRNPDDAKLYSNRAACYAKLMEFHLALKDCDECLKRDPTFVKAYLRKGAVLVAMKETSKARDAFEKALDLDPNCAEAEDGMNKCIMDNHKNPEEARKKAMNDPEIMKILQDPAMRMILEQVQANPQALMDHLKNPDVAQKFQKLIESGIVGLK